MDIKLDDTFQEELDDNPTINSLRDFLNYSCNVIENTSNILHDYKSAVNLGLEALKKCKYHMDLIKSDTLNHIIYTYLLILNAELSAVNKDEDKTKFFQYEVEDALMELDLDPRFLVDNKKDIEEANIAKGIKIATVATSIALTRQDEDEIEDGVFYSYFSYKFFKVLKDRYNVKLTSIYTKSGLVLIDFLNKLEKDHLISEIYDDIIQFQEKYVDINKDDEDELFNLGTIYSNYALNLIKTNRINKAINCLIHSVKIYKDLLKINKNKILLEELLKSYDALNMLLSDVENTELFYRYLQEEYNYLENYKKELKHVYRRSYKECLKLMIKYHYKKSDFEAALFYIEKALPYISNPREIIMMRFNKAGSLLGLKKIVEAKQLFLEISKEISDEEKDEDLLKLKELAKSYYASL